MKSKGSTLYRIFCIIISFIVVLMCLFPLFWMAMAGFKPEREVLSVPFKFFPSKWVTENFTTLFEDETYNFIHSMYITFIVASIATFLVLAVNSMAGYAFARLEFKYKTTIWRIIILTMFIPGITILITSFILVTRLNILNTYAVLILPGVAGAYNIFFFRQFFLNVPMALEESALIDGASRFRIFLSIFLPNAKSPLVIVGIGAFVGYWNSFLWPTLTITDTNLYQVMQIIRSYRGLYSSKYGVIMGASFLAALVPITIFLIFQKYLVQGILISGIK